ADVPKGAELAGGTRLDEDVPERRRLDGSDERGPAGHLGGQATEQLVAGASPDHVDGRQVTAADGLQAFEHEPVLASKRDEDRSHHLAAVAGLALTAPATGGRDPRRHVAGGEEAVIVGVEERDVRGRRG